MGRVYSAPSLSEDLLGEKYRVISKNKILKIYGKPLAFLQQCDRIVLNDWREKKFPRGPAIRRGVRKF